MLWSLSEKEAAILQLLSVEEELYGLQLVDRSEGQLKRGTVYVTLGRMEEKGLVCSRLEEETPKRGGLPRRLYKQTALGRTVFSSQQRIVRRFKEVLT
jgi:PadR family transcriptional regulator, regulatory protein PadR